MNPKRIWQNLSGYNQNLTEATWELNGCGSRDRWTQERCGCTDGIEVGSGFGFRIIECANCHRATIIYKDQIALELSSIHLREPKTTA